MTIKSKMYLYNILTTLFALITILCLGGITDGNGIISALINSAFFGMLTLKCFEKENILRSILMRKKLSRRHLTLKVIKRNAQHRAA